VQRSSWGTLLAWRPRRPQLWVAALLLGLLSLMFWVSHPRVVPGAVVLSSVVAAVPDRPDIKPKTVDLPHILDDESQGWHKRVQYSLTWPATVQYESPEHVRLALLIPRVGTRFRVLLNGHEVFNVGWYAPSGKTVNAAWEPYLVPLPAIMLQPDAADNLLDIQVEGRLLERSGLWPVQLGDRDLLGNRYAWLYGWQVTGTWMMVMTATLMGLMSVFLWWLLRERLFVLMAAASLSHAVRLVLSVVVEPLMGAELYFLLHRISFTFYCAFLCLFIEELFGLKLKAARWLAYFLVGFGPLWIGLILWTGEYNLYRVWAGLLLLVALSSLLMATYRSNWGRAMSPSQLVVLLVAGFTLLTGLRDFLVVQLNFSGDADIRWTSLGSLALMFTLGWVLLQRATASMVEVRRLNSTLAQTVAEREAELRAAFEKLRAADLQHSIEDERRRLMRDMHDGLGSQLVQTLNMVRNSAANLNPQTLAAMLNHALEELRMTLDSLEPMDGDLPTILGTLRHRVAPALESVGLTLDWQVQEVHPVTGMDSRSVMHLFRCVQEVFANVAKHAQATRVVVRTWNSPGRVHLLVADNGRGLPAFVLNSQGRGRGLNNIRVRASKMGATVHFSNAEPGLGVEFVFPVADL
jgi:signal transduction histidine kinase